MKGQSRVVGLACKPLKAWFSEMGERESMTGFSLCGSVCYLYYYWTVYFTLYNASVTFFVTLGKYPDIFEYTQIPWCLFPPMKWAHFTELLESSHEARLNCVPR